MFIPRVLIIPAGETVNVNAKGGDEKITPLHDAVMAGHTEIVQLVLQNRGSILL